MNDDRIGRCLERVFETLPSNLIVEVVRQVVQEFDVALDELHNDSTTVTFSGDYPTAQTERTRQGLTTPAITWGHNKDHRPDLKQLLYILTVSEDGGVPVYFQAASGNVVDDQTHQATWELMAELVGHPDFVYVADCKLATTENMNKIDRQRGRFITVLPATRKENSQFRQRLVDTPQTISWQLAYQVTADEGTLDNIFQVCGEEHLSKEGDRVLWFHSRSKAESDAATRARRVQRAIAELTDLRAKLRGPKTRFRDRKKVATAVEDILASRSAGDYLQVEIHEHEEEAFRQTTRGRPSKNTKYTRTVVTRFDLCWQLNNEQLTRAAAGDGVFPLLTNIPDWQSAEVLKVYKRQPMIEKRFSQLKTDFCVAPVYLKSVSRIVGLLAIYFFALMVQSLLERELRRAMSAEGVESIPLYPESRACSRPTTRQLLDVFEPLSRHTIKQRGRKAEEVLTTELAPLHLELLKLLGISPADYRA